MAAASFPVSKTVQELIINSQQLPHNYICKDGVLEEAASLPSMDIPVIDFSILQSSSTCADSELHKLHSALSSWGCFQAINHGIQYSFLDKVREITKQFFALGEKEKQKYSREVDGMEGYGNDMIFSENQTLDWCDRLYLKVCPQDQHKLEFWPENPSAFRETLYEYTMKLRWVPEVLMKAMARSLHLEENCFLEQYGELAMFYARFNFFPPCPRPDLVLGLKPHSDGSAITIVLQDKEVEGLQFLKGDQWIKVPVIPDALLVNLGDQMEIMSNGVFKSPVHRVVINSERERISVVMFCLPGPDMEIKPVDGLVDERMPTLYKKVKDYTQTYFEDYQQGKRPIDAVKI